MTDLLLSQEGDFRYCSFSRTQLDFAQYSMILQYDSDYRYTNRKHKSERIYQSEAKR